MKNEIYSKEYSIGKILSEAWIYFKENFYLIAIVTVIIYIPINIILSLFPVETIISGQDTLKEIKIYARVSQILEGLIGIIATMAIAYAIKLRIDEKEITAEGALKKSLSKWPAVVGTNILLGIFIFGLFLLLIIPGVIYSVYWMFTPYVVMLCNKSGKAALDHSKEIIKGRWWKVLGYSFVFGILTFLVVIGINIPLSIVPDVFVLNIISDTITSVFLSYFVVVTTIFFINFDNNRINHLK